MGRLSADGKGGTVKRLAAKANVQKVHSNKVQTPYEQLNYCSNNIHNFMFFYVQEEQVLNCKKELAD
jgi:hypothetical protein